MSGDKNPQGGDAGKEGGMAGDALTFRVAFVVRWLLWVSGLWLSGRWPQWP